MLFRDFSGDFQDRKNFLHFDERYDIVQYCQGFKTYVLRPKWMDSRVAKGDRL